MLTLTSPQLAALWLKERVRGALHADSRPVGAGDGFIAWPGAATDGRKHVAAALAQGAAACLVEYEGVDAFGFDQGEHSDRIAAYPGLKAATGPIASAFHDNPSALLDVLAVTGTNGKTSTAWWLAESLSTLRAAGGVRAMRPDGTMERDAPSPCAVMGTLGIGVPPDLTYTGLTTPDPVMMQGELRALVERGFGACAIEASSIGIAERRLDGAQIAVAVFTNFTQDHLDYHGSMDAYWEAKAELFRWPGLRAAVINIDDMHGASLCANLVDAGIGALDVWTVSAGGKPARLVARDIGYDAQGLQFSVAEHGTASVERLSTGLIGQYNVANLLGVLGTLRALGLTLSQAVAACANLTSVPGRMERVSVAADAPLAVVDYAHTPDALDKALAGLRPLAQQRGGALWCLFGCGGDRDPIKRPMMAAVAERQADHVIVTSDNPRSEKPDAIISQVLRGFSRSDAAQVQPDRAAAIADAIAQAAPQDVVLIAGKGHEAWQEIAGQRIPFSDKTHALDALNQRGVA
ncbi:UDP-N-acetylmuramoyl-L-alanyl-D-glutamate--2,6-diaminopimelate ligase [Variovorax boronicumulans]|uniref:UDP-N-acetylmuramoyl-L-alanyl-D-glutamate--2, 6-diaminopimelate ligase n=1 Tax=Variovorax boronicumulans TaxID=436515 RepID=UPI00278A6125|nr:UDP-N-acetylmuramoyl-L-alanyl-D-glutamate--2,6-diaminopimelate ligase [Variovorax boronicumulans]MDQ0015784.1 UDP-N-acetylmuramoyl-L-alanyl-D-glutamate--2,6-diaminopimelate ligase [Variovorax boronicumulans]